MGKTRISKLISGELSLDRSLLECMFRDNVADVPQGFMMYLTDWQITKYLIYTLYTVNMQRSTQEEGMIIKTLSLAFGVKYTTVYKWCKIDIPKITQQQNKRESERT